MKPMHNPRFAICLIIALLLTVSGCNGTPNHAQESSQSEPTVLREFPPDTLLLPQESSTIKVKGESGVDYGNSSDGYIMAWYFGSKAAKVQVIKLDDSGQNPTWNYDIDNPQKKEVLPLQAGSGRYKVYVAEHLEGDKYSPIVEVEFDASISNDLSPFLFPTKYSMFSVGSMSVEKANELTRGCNSDIEAIEKIYVFIKDNISYDTEKAETIKNFYTPNPDETLAIKKGICFDYASLTCAMFRANGIPTRLVTGRVSGDLSHAWNSVYLENEGWVDGHIRIHPDTWELIDLTFAAGSNSSEQLIGYIGNGESYTELKFY